MESALRELWEELGICAEEADLHFLGWNYYCFDEVFYGKEFRNREISKVYLYCKPVDTGELKLQKEEVADARWASKEEIEAMIDDGSFIPYQKDLIGYLFFAREGRGTWNL